MTGTLVLILRILLALSLYAFLGWAVLTIWRDLRTQAFSINAPLVPALTLQLFGEDTPRIFAIPEVIIGRSPGSDLSIPDDTVSARHARLSYHHSQWWVEDVGSTNGTYLNDERVSVPTVIVSGDDLRLGQVDMVLSVDDKGR